MAAILGFLVAVFVGVSASADGLNYTCTITRSGAASVAAGASQKFDFSGRWNYTQPLDGRYVLKINSVSEQDPMCAVSISDNASEMGGTIRYCRQPLSFKVFTSNTLEDFIKIDCQPLLK
jgi:hypothetical protein